MVLLHTAEARETVQLAAAKTANKPDSKDQRSGHLSDSCDINPMDYGILGLLQE